MRHLIVISIGLILLAGCASSVGEAPSSYMVFFQQSDAQLSVGARAVVDQAAFNVRSTHPAEVTIAVGNATNKDLRLADPRLLAVRQALIADGVPDQMIVPSAITGASVNVGETGDQRVVITLIAKTPS